LTASAILARLEAAGVAVVPDGATLRLRSARPIPPDLVALARAEKPALLRLVMTHADILAAVSTWPDDLRDMWGERAAIREYDGGATREAAERGAYDDYVREAPR